MLRKPEHYFWRAEMTEPGTTELKLGEILIKEGFLTEEQLAECLGFQKAKEGYVPLGEILVGSGYIPRQELRHILRKYRKRMKLGEVLLTLGLIDEPQLTKALVLQKEKGKRLGELLVEMGIISEEQLISALSEHLDLPKITPHYSLVDKDLFLGLNLKFLLASYILPLYKDNEAKEVIVITADPFAEDILDILEKHFKCPLSLGLASRVEINTTIQEVLQAIELGKISPVSEFKEAGKNLIIQEIGFSPGIERTILTVNYILAEAVRREASDIHIEPQSGKVRVRLRIDGMLQDLTDWPASSGQAIASRIKVLCGLDIAERRRHQDGKIEAKIMGKEIDLRVSTYSSMYGENIVIRILHRKTNLIEIDRLGFSPANKKEFERILNIPSGVILVTGPTGSGKTTTLYSAIIYLLNLNKSIITVEDPVEYSIDGVIQGKLDPKVGQSYSDFLKAMMRQDPDVIMIGEIRDNNSAVAAIQAALTGHKILSSFHTDDTTGALLRLLDMGIETFLISSTVISVISQRLLRLVCRHCREEYQPDPELLRGFRINPAEARNFKFMRGRGCRICRNTGYKGRTAIHEVLLVNDAIRDAILARKTSTEIRHIGRTAAGLISLREDGIYKSLKGVTNLEEVMRVVFHSESDQYSPRSLAEIFDICEMREIYGRAPELKIPFIDEPLGVISVFTPAGHPLKSDLKKVPPSDISSIELLRIRLNVTDASSEIDKIGLIFNEYISARKSFNASVGEMALFDFMEYLTSRIARLKLMFGIEFVEVVLREEPKKVNLYLETASRKGLVKEPIVMGIQADSKRIMEELDFENFLAKKRPQTNISVSSLQIQ
jgi:type IV pilus assembly protein PilB